MTDPNLAFIRHKSRHAVTWSLLNLQTLHAHPCATALGSPLAGRTAYVVGADYTLTRNGEQLAKAQRKGGVIIGVNSSDPVLRTLGVVPDAIVVRESIDNSKEIKASKAPLICLDVCAHPEMWAAAEERLAWFIPGYPRHFDLCETLGVRPTFGGTAAFTTAVHLARVWGAERIVMVGAGLAMQEDEDGRWRCYHPEAPRGDCIGELVGEALTLSGNVANDAVCLASGQVPQPKTLTVEHVPAQNWGPELPIIDVLVDQRDWLQTEAKRHGANVEMINASEGGCGISGWRTERLADVVKAMPRTTGAVRFPAVPSVTLKAQRQLIDDMRRQADVLSDACRLMLGSAPPSVPRSAQHSTRRIRITGFGPDLRAMQTLEGLYEGAPLAEALAAHRIIEAPKGDALTRCRYTYEAMATAAGEARAILARGAG